ncbi:catechol 1,2-dioxygenase [Pokkaliibacter sp. MBI-7]|uniref:catechol 1,2-dioxygenase n=1 Tax=Pokkaliibacter sp. MBI-7 TaxID=3040600 RepID=UPI00244BCF0F|nr:catechol 1,2-dioxygenase [Pokkaliibacter sp. MBI-7]MDH2434094.1 catechol 1,2-dioxygenase [Pokkaliibacter sp. MBI-7]
MTVSIAKESFVTAFLEQVSGFDNDQGNPRAKQVINRLLTDLCCAIDDLDIRPEEFWMAVNYINELGTNKETALLAAGLGLEHYLDLRLDKEDELAGETGGTPRTIEGPLYVAGAPLSDGEARLDDGSEEGEVLFMQGQVKDMDGQPIAGAIVDVWHANGLGNYSYFDKSQSDFNLRRRIRTDENGVYRFRSTIPVGYGCPPQGSTQALLNLLGRHGQRPAHIHFFISADGYQHLTTQINLDGDKYLHDDFAYATRDELIAQITHNSDHAAARDRGVDAPFAEIDFDFTLRATEAKDKEARGARLRALESV